MIKKKTLLCSLALLFAMAMPVQAQKPIQLWINGKYVQTDVAPVVENQRTLVPMRVISENLGIQVKWDQATQTVTTYQMTPNGPDFSNSLVLTIGDKRVAKPAEEAAKTGELYYTLEAAPKAVNNRTMVPIRFIAEAYKIKVDWDQQNQTVVIGENYKAPTPQKTPDQKKKPAPAKKPSTNVPIEYKSALAKAKSYSKLMHMSKQRIYEQLISPYGEKFSESAATWAIQNLTGINWKQNALEKAKSYQNSMHMSPERIRDQLTSEYGEKFTQEEADWAIANLNK